MNQLNQFLQQLSQSISSHKDPSSSTHVSGNLHAYLASSSKNSSWIIDSGATDHMVNNPSLVSNFTPISNKHDISIANGSTVPIQGIGEVKFFPHGPHSNALVVPSFPVQLLSVGKITNSLNCDVIFSPTNIIF